MSKKSRDIPVNMLPKNETRGIMIIRKRFDRQPDHDSIGRSHRDGGYTFIVLEQGALEIEIDFEVYSMKGPSIIFIKQDQVHRLISFNNALISTSIITEENIRPEHLEVLQKMSPVRPLMIDKDIVKIISDSAKLCIRILERKVERLHHAMLKDSCNTFITLIISQYLANTEPFGKIGRTEFISNSFKTALEQGFKKIKTPGEYAEVLSISTSYLNECVKAVTGRPVTSHIHQRVMLEAKRLLFHSGRSIKEIAMELGYDDQSYFNRLFTKIVGCTPRVFRHNNRE